MATYVGNPDYRGWLNADPNKRWALEFVGNDGGINQDKLSMYTDTPVGTGTYAGRSYEQAVNDLNNYYRQYRTLGSSTATSKSNRGTPALKYDPADLAFLDTQAGLLRDLLSRTDISLNQGLTGLEDSYNKEVRSANRRQSEALSGYATQREDTQRDKLEALSKVDTNARTLADSVRRILGLASGSGSSAYKLAAPMAIARQATEQRSGVQDTFGRNLRNIDTAETRTKLAFEELLEDLAAQKRQRESDLRAGVEERRLDIDRALANIAGERARLLGGGYNNVRIAQQPYLDSIRNRQSAIDSLFDRFRTPYNVKPVEVATPDLSQYTVDRAAINANQQMGQSQYSPYAQFLLNKQQDEENRIV